MNALKGYLLIISVLMLHSCADYKLHYSRQAQSWESNTPTPGLALEHSVFLIGDAGGLVEESTSPALLLLGEKLRQAGKKSSVVYLGDNIYPNGMAPKNGPDRAADEARLKAQLDILKGYEGKVFFIVGNHDWYEYGLDGLNREKKFIENYLDRKDVLLPKPGCGEPEEVELSENLVLILIDTQWYLENWDGHSEINDGCEIKSRDVFQEYVEEAIKGNRNKNVVIAMHHPPYTNGPHGGDFTLKQHIFPLTDVSDNLWIPLPVLGSVVQFLRGTVGHPQDASHPKYRELANIVINAARKNGNFFIASGHEHNLQYIEQDEQFFIVSGAGSKESPSRLGKGTELAYGHQGFAQLDFYKDGSAWIQYWIPEAGSKEGRVIYRKQVKGPLPDIVEEAPKDFQPIPETLEIPISQENYKKGKLWDFFWGKHYRDVYNAVVPVSTLKLDEAKGGLKPVKRGGGYQTNSLRFETEDGKQYVVRSIDKDPSRTLGYPFNQSFVTEVVKDNFSASHPLSAIPAARLAEAVGIYYTSPELAYLPAQPALDIYNDEFANSLYLFEERPDDDKWADTPQFGNSRKILSTSDMLAEVLGEHDRLIDYRWVVRSRLFDVLIGDWDRHDDQWRWAEIDEGKYEYYRPIPRDRDQAFCKYDGLLLGIARGTAPDIKKLQIFNGRTKRIQWLVYNARHFDRNFLSGADWSTWEEEVRRIQAAVTDERIDAAFRKGWPAAVYALDGDDITRKLKARRDNLMDMARDYYKYITREVEVIGTSEKDLFTIERLPGGQTRIRVYDTNDKGEKEFLFYGRTFDYDETKQILIYGLDDDDIFEVTGQAEKAIMIRIIGGLGKDSFTDKSSIEHGGKRLIYYDTDQEKNNVQVGEESVVKYKKDPKFNIYNRKAIDHSFNYSSMLPSAGFNPDDGALLGIFGQYTTYGFKKSPYASQHNLKVSYALATSGFAVDYSSEFIDLFGKWEFSLKGAVQTALYSINYYGLGNESVNLEAELDTDALDFNRVRQRLYRFSPSLMRRLNSQSLFSIGPSYEAIRVERTEGRFIDDVGDEFDEGFFDGQKFLGVQMVLNYRNLDNIALPSRGIGLFLDAGYKHQVKGLDKSFPYLNASFTAYQNLDRARNLVFATRVGVQHRFNNQYEFYQGAMLSGPGPDANFRGFRRNRFIGTTAFYQNIDLRLRLFSSSNETLPFSLGITAGFDHGRVWLEGEESDTWHYAYGGGLWFSPFDMFVVNTSLFRGDNKANRVNITGTFFF
ncbi:MAG: metallophosphoesterase [Phaeodactylibacter sp.]|nr:metallophosphoesterase [Phaeodactylibacter sp.]MCB9053174.1 metallophosphoesterase [Lewinellaceae bacterium]